ncbi:MAG: hypothetical protein RL557_848 [archaeon]|jgi:2'-5' RNA ligase
MKLTRCFVATQLSPAAIAEIKRIQEGLMDRFHFDGKLTEPEQLHLTLKFLGEIDEPTLQTVRKQLFAIHFEPLSVALISVGVFSSHTPRIVWIALDGADGLQHAVDKSLEHLFSIEKQFMGHITIARLKHLEEKKEFLRYLNQLHCSTRFTIDRFFLNKSILTPSGTIYETIEEYVARITF